MPSPPDGGEPTATNRGKVATSGRSRATGGIAFAAVSGSVAAMLSLPFRLLALTVLLGANGAAADDPAAANARWRGERVASLTRAEGWLSLIGLHWLQPGDNTIGSAAHNTLRLAAGPDRLGLARLEADGTILFTAASDTVTIDGQAVASAPLRYDGEAPTLVRSGTVSLYVIKRGEKLGLRVKDTASPRRRDFAGIDYFAFDPAWRIEARWVPFPEPREIPITNLLGQTSPALCPGKAVFTHEGRTVELLPIAEGPGDLFFVISDRTSGAETYGACRFVYASPPVDGRVVLDFNRAQNPPCAFTPFATCPLPPKENQLPFRVTAGEKNYRGEHH